MTDGRQVSHRVQGQYHLVRRWCLSDTADSAGRIFPTVGKGAGVMATYMAATAGRKEED